MPPRRARRVVVERVLERMEDGAVDKKDCEEATALIHAAQKGSLPLVRCLTGKWQAKCSVQDWWGNGALYYACANGHILVATYLLGLGANINEGNKQRNTPAPRCGEVGTHRDSKVAVAVRECSTSTRSAHIRRKYSSTPMRDKVLTQRQIALRVHEYGADDTFDDTGEKLVWVQPSEQNPRVEGPRGQRTPNVRS